MKFKMLLLIWFFLLFSCSGEDKAKQESTDIIPPDNKPVESLTTSFEETHKEQVLVVVGETEITHKDLDFAIKKIIGAEAAERMDEKAKRKVLESMVASRAISILRLEELTEQEYINFEQEVAAFKEQLLVREYFSKHGSPEPISMEMIQEYYDNHPELYGAKTEKKF